MEKTKLQKFLKKNKQALEHPATRAILLATFFGSVLITGQILTGTHIVALSCAMFLDKVYLFCKSL